MNIIEAIETISDDDPVYVKKIQALDTIMDRGGVVYDKEQGRLVENRDPDYKV